MKRVFLGFLVFIVGICTYAQENKEVSLNKGTNLLDVTYYHDNGVVSQVGSYTLEGKLHGDWTKFNTEGEKIVAAKYDHGKKVGKWFYWNDKTLKEVDYKNNAIVSVNEWRENSYVLKN